MKASRAKGRGKAVPRPRNPHARALGSGAFKPKVVKNRDSYRRKPKHPKEGGGEDLG